MLERIGTENTKQKTEIKSTLSLCNGMKFLHLKFGLYLYCLQWKENTIAEERRGRREQEEGKKSD